MLWLAYAFRFETSEDSLKSCLGGGSCSPLKSHFRVLQPADCRRSMARATIWLATAAPGRSHHLCSGMSRGPARVRVTGRANGDERLSGCKMAFVGSSRSENRRTMRSCAKRAMVRRWRRRWCWRCWRCHWRQRGQVVDQSLREGVQCSLLTSRTVRRCDERRPCSPTVVCFSDIAG